MEINHFLVLNQVVTMGLYFRLFYLTAQQKTHLSSLLLLKSGYSNWINLFLIAQFSPDWMRKHKKGMSRFLWSQNATLIASLQPLGIKREQGKDNVGQWKRDRWKHFSLLLEHLLWYYSDDKRWKRNVVLLPNSKIWQSWGKEKRRKGGYPIDNLIGMSPKITNRSWSTD